MPTFNEVFTKFLTEERQITSSELSNLEKQLDRLWAEVGVDVEFTRHFLDRVNDARNKKQITIGELQHIYSATYERHGEKISDIARKKKNLDAILKDVSTAINIPIDLRYNKSQKKIEMTAKTVMRKRDFVSHERPFVVK